ERIAALSGEKNLQISKKKWISIKEKLNGASEVTGKAVFGDLYAALSSKLRKIAELLFAKDVFPSTLSGVVIAGFGEDEIFPSVVTYEVEGICSGFLRWKLSEDRSDKVDT